jgi:hypothetical protein
MFSANNTNDKGAFANFSNVATTWKRSVYNMELPVFASPYNSLVNKDNSVAKQRGTKAIVVDSDQIANSSPPVQVRATAEQWTFTPFWTRYYLLLISCCLYGFAAGTAKGYALGPYSKIEITFSDKLKTILEVVDQVKDVSYLVLISHSLTNTVILASSIVAAPIVVLSVPGFKFSDLYAIGNYN